MRKIAVVGILGAMLLASPALAQPKAYVEAKLAAPLSEPKKLIIDGRLWRCKEDVCLGQEQGDSQSIKRECARVVKAVGPLVAYRNGQRELSAEDVAACNGGATAQLSKAN